MTENIFRPGPSLNATVVDQALSNLGTRIEDLYDRMKEFEAILNGFKEILIREL